MSNIIEKCPILSNIAQYCPILLCIIQYYSNDYLSSLLQELWYWKEDIVHYCQIYPNNVRHWLILSTTDQYCLSCYWPDFDETLVVDTKKNVEFNFLEPDHFTPNFVPKICWTQKSLGPKVFLDLNFYIKLTITCKNLFLSLVVVRLVIFVLDIDSH